MCRKLYKKPSSKSIIIDAQTKTLYKKLEHLQTELTNAQEVAKDAIKRAELSEQSIITLQSENIALKNKLNNIEHNEIRDIRELIEDRTNRQLRSTLTIKGIADAEEGRETWEQTEVKLVRAFTDVGIPNDQANKMVERAHRARPNPKRKGPAPIYVKFHSWKQSEQVKSAFLEKNMISSTGIFADQKYGPLTSMRRNLALQLRRELKDKGTITKAFVKFPAKLMVKTSHSNTERYREHTDFSKEAVTFGNR